MLDPIRRIPLADLPTPLEEAPRLGNHLGLSRLLIKRDDQTGLAMGGNKARKLEYDFAEILDRGDDVVLTVGGAQSNHARMTAAAARKLGLDAKLVLGGPDVDGFPGNMLIDALLGAEIRFLKDNDDNDALTAAMEEWAAELQAAGRRPSLLPIGGSTALGALGYVRAMQELAGQFGPGDVQVVLAVGSCGTLAGALLGARLFMPRARVIGISVSRTADRIARRTSELATGSARLLGSEITIGPGEVESYDAYVDRYGVMTPAGRQAMITCARLEGLLLDPVYTAKAMAGFMDLIHTGVIERTVPAVFIHTGGSPILFSFERELRDLTLCTRI